MDKPKLLDQVRDAIRVKHYSMRTKRRMCLGLNDLSFALAK